MSEQAGGITAGSRTSGKHKRAARAHSGIRGKPAKGADAEPENGGKVHFGGWLMEGMTNGREDAHRDV